MNKILIAILTFISILTVCGLCMGDGSNSDNNTTNGSNITDLNDTVLIHEPAGNNTNLTSADENSDFVIYSTITFGLLLIIFVIYLSMKFKKSKLQEKKNPTELTEELKQEIKDAQEIILTEDNKLIKKEG